MSVQLIQQYHAQVEKLIRYGGTRNESALRQAFHELLQKYAAGRDLLVVPECEVRTATGRRVVPDATLKDSLRQDWGHWESKDEKDDLESEIAAKLAKGYPTFNILFEDTQTAVLYQGGVEVQRAGFSDAPSLDALLTRFISYEPPEVTAFHRAIEQFNADVPALAAELRAVVQEQLAANAAFRQAIGEFLELCKKAINPNVEMADAREMIIQHILTEDVFMTIFDDPAFHRDNAVARKLQEVVGTFYIGVTRHRLRDRIAPYYESVNARAASIANHREKQKFLKALYETFYRAYNPKAADRLGVIYTPDEIVRFMIEGADALVFRHFGKTLGDTGVEILDPCVGTGTFVTELIEYLPEGRLPFKYHTEIHCNEVAILPYYIANLNIEYTYRQKMGEYAPYENICFVDTLDNMGFGQGIRQGQLDFFAIVDENIERVRRQNERRISVIIGNPPYNAWQENFNLQNPNRPYKEIDRRIRDTYVKQGTAQNQIALYDMYVRFFRWASDRIAEDGIVAFVANSSFLDARTFDGFRKVVAEEFDHIYAVNLKGNARTSGERRRREGGNVFSDQIRVGVAIYFLVRKQGETGCRIWHNAVPDYARAEEKKAYLSGNEFARMMFEPIHPDRRHNWLNLSDNDWDELVPLMDKAVKSEGQAEAIFRLFSNGVKTQRDDWMYDRSRAALEDKVRYFVQVYDKTLADPEAPERMQIKWDRELTSYLARAIPKEFNAGQIVHAHYRPFIKAWFYFDPHFNGRTYQLPSIFPAGRSNVGICFTDAGSAKPFMTLATDALPDLHLVGAGASTQVLPLYSYTSAGERVENITDWALARFREHYADDTITRLDIFHYVYAVLHHPAYRETYKINLKREFPRIPFYDDFRRWAEWGRQLMDLHLNYEQAEPYPLARKDLDPEALRRPVVPRLIARKETGVIEVDTLTTLRGVPPEAWDYRLGTYTALEWILERYKERKPRDPTIRERFNTYRFADYKEQVIDLLHRVCTVSVETMAIIRQMPA
jgi:predicted helicase